jgi:RNA polymerase sigma factor (sigma-70 family)
MSPLAISLRFLQTQPDQRLVELARAGHERAFEALVRRYRGPLLAYCRRIAPRGTPPEDILQQGLLQAWRALREGAEVREARAWLYRIVHNVSITAVRAARELPDSVTAEPGAPAVDQVVEQRIAAREALAGLAGLPELQRQVMVSAALDGRSHDEIAAALGLSSGSVRGLIYRARSTLRAAAAAVMPTPVIQWALGDAGGTSTGLAGTASAGLGASGLGALVLKGGAVLAVGAAAGTAGIVLGHQTHPAQSAGRAAPAAYAHGGRTPEHGTTRASSWLNPQTGPHGGSGRGPGRARGGGQAGSGDGRGQPMGVTGGDGSQGGGGGTQSEGPGQDGSGGSGDSNGNRSGPGDGGSDASGPGGDRLRTTASTNSSDAGHGEGSSSGGSGGSDGGNSSGSAHGDGSSGSSGSSDGGDSGGSSSGGSGSGQSGGSDHGGGDSIAGPGAIAFSGCRSLSSSQDC